MRHQRSSSCVSSRCFSTLLYFLLVLLLLTNASYFVSASDEDYDPGPTFYCRLCERHTMCLFVFDDGGDNCINVEDADLDPEEILSIVHQHNVQRNNIASGLEIRGNPGPQPPARSMMELTWDEELARLARRWALQCHPDKKDECRNVERFAVWQNMNTFNLDSGMETGTIGVSGDQHNSIEEEGNTTNTTAFMRLRFHVQSWFDEVEHFDTARVGLVDFSKENDTSYIAIAGAKITRVGCGRATYSVDLGESTEEVEVARSEVPLSVGETLQAAEVESNKNGRHISRVEVLVCNYGPIDPATPHNLYESGAHEACSDGSVPSIKYDRLCVRTVEPRDFLPRDSEDRNGEDTAKDPSLPGIVGSTDGEEEKRSNTRSSAVSIALQKSTSSTGTSESFRALAEFLSLVLLHIITRAPGARCCWSW